jgi:IS5 family transposase
MSQFGLFDLSDRLAALSAFGDPLERLSQVVNFEIFRPSLESGFNFSDGSQGGRPPYDGVLIFKVLVLQSLYNLSDDQTEYQIKDRLSFMRFLDLDLCENVPDAKTIWLYRERLKKKGLMDCLFSLFDQTLRERGYLAMGGQIVDASIIQSPRQRMTKEEKTQVKAGEIPEDWKAHPAKLAQKDREARWVVKYSKAKGEGKAVDLAIPFFGYKNHVSMDRRYGFIRKYQTTDASLYDGHVLSQLLDKNNTSSCVWGDTAYRSQDNEKLLVENGFRSQLHRKKPRNKPMPVATQRTNGKKSKIRASVEHVFAVQKERMRLFIRTIGLQRARIKVTLANLTYNLQRLIFWEKRVAPTG